MSNQAANIRAELARLGKTQGELAPLLYMTHQAVSKRMKRHEPFTDDELVRIAKFLGVPVARLKRKVAS